MKFVSFFVTTLVSNFGPRKEWILYSQINTKMKIRWPKTQFNYTNLSKVHNSQYFNHKSTAFYSSKWSGLKFDVHTTRLPARKNYFELSIRRLVCGVQSRYSFERSYLIFERSYLKMIKTHTTHETHLSSLQWQTFEYRLNTSEKFNISWN